MFLDFLKTDMVPFMLVNTGTMLDIATGVFKPGVDGTWVLDGGLSQTFGIMGRGQTYKSNLAGSFIAHALENHPDACAYIYETEGTVSDATRYDQFVSTKVSDRIIFRNNTTDDLTSFYNNFNQIIEAKEAQRKDLIVETPFLDKDGKPIRTWIPTFVLIDSYSRASSNKADNAINENDIDSSALNSWYMVNGNAKTKLLADFVGKATKYGIYGIFTAHIGDKIEMNPFAPTGKQMQFMKVNDKLKNVGSNFTFLTSCLVHTLKAEVCLNSSKKCEYPKTTAGSKLDVEVNRIETRFVRSKNNASGMGVSYVVSQYQGILNSVTNFEFINQNHFGITVGGNKNRFTPILNPNDTFTKLSLRQDSHTKYELCRGLELLAQLCYVQMNWDLDELPSVLSIPVETIAEMLYQCELPTINRVLNSCGVWSTGKLERERLTLIDALLLIEKEASKKKLKTTP